MTLLGLAITPALTPALTLVGPGLPLHSLCSQLTQHSAIRVRVTVRVRVAVRLWRGLRLRLRHGLGWVWA